MNKIPVTVLVPIKNEERNLQLSLPLLSDFDEVIILDSQSSDTSLELAAHYGAEVHQFYWDGKFPKKRNWALQNLRIKNEWVLFLDADEYVTPEFITELKAAIARPEINGYWIVFRNYFMGKQLKYGDQFKKLPLFRKGSGEYERIAEDSWSHLDMEVHEHPILEGKVGTFKTHINHNDYKGLEHYIAKHNSYSSWEARRYIKLQETGFAGLNSRQRLKYWLIGLGLMPMAYFLGNYFLKLGFLDGRAGYYFSKYKSQYFFQIQTKIKELQA